MLVALVGCDGVIINGIAGAMGLDYPAVDFDCQSQIDVRGPKGAPGARPYFEGCDLTIVLYTDEPEKRVHQLVKNVEYRGPVMNRLRTADVQLNVDWQTRPAAQA